MPRKKKVQEQEPQEQKGFLGSLKKVKISDLKGARYNPKSRVDPKGTRFRQLMRSISDEGLIYPIAVQPDMTIMDGHRRTAACKELGWTEVPVLVIPNNNPERVYASINNNAQMMKGLEILQIWLQEPNAVSVRAANFLASLDETFGRAMLRKCVKSKLSYHTLGAAQRIAKYCEDESDDFLVKAADWLIEHRCVRLVKNYITLKQPPEQLWLIVEENQALEYAFAGKKRKPGRPRKGEAFN